MVNFPTRIPDCDTHSPALLNLSLLTRLIVLHWHSLYWEILVMLSQFPWSCCLSFHWISFSHSGRHPFSLHNTTYDYSRADCDGLRSHLRDVLWEDIFKVGASAAAAKFCEWISGHASFISMVFSCFCSCHSS